MTESGKIQECTNQVTKNRANIQITYEVLINTNSVHLQIINPETVHNLTGGSYAMYYDSRKNQTAAQNILCDQERCRRN